ncbi:hypothetical protein Q0M65_14125, partial [Staphylococcus aureus]|nr:hypothetical protein [Staphylococcus aureus]
TQGLTLVNGVAPTPVGNTQAGPGTPFEIKSTNIIRAKPKQAVQKDDYAWEEPEQPTGILGRAAELIVSLVRVPLEPSLTLSQFGR